MFYYYLFLVFFLLLKSKINIANDEVESEDESDKDNKESPGLGSALSTYW